MHKSIGYHTRDSQGQKLTGGSFGGSIDLETVNRLVNTHFSVRVKPSGCPTFVSRTGQDVNLYISIDPDMTDKGKEALKAWREEERKREQLQEQKEKELQDILDSMTVEDAIFKLTGR